MEKKKEEKAAWQKEIKKILMAEKFEEAPAAKRRAAKQAAQKKTSAAVESKTTGSQKAAKQTAADQAVAGQAAGQTAANQSTADQRAEKQEKAFPGQAKQSVGKQRAETRGEQADKKQEAIRENGKTDIFPQGRGVTGAHIPKVIGKAQVEKAMETLKKYKSAKHALEERVVANERWYKLRHWELIRRERKDQNVEPTTAWLFNALANKHADVMDSYPEAVVLPREPGDEEDAKMLSGILPVIMERNEYEQTYSDVWWYKLKNGAGVYGVFWNKELENGIGDIDIKKIDLLNLFWEPGITDIQKSRNLFIVDTMDHEQIAETYGIKAEQLSGGIIDIREYVHEDMIDMSDKSLVIDWYYKKRNASGRQVLHYCKIIGDTLVYASENDALYQQRGFYDHGMYPVVFDVLFPEEDTPVGFGFVDIMKDAQTYIDKLNQIVIKNAMITGKKRFFIREGGGVNEKEFADWSRDFVHVEGSLDEGHIKEIKTDPLDGYIVNHLQNKISELKETSGNRDFSQGGTGGGVTAASAIAALQEAGSKISRDMIKGAYRAFVKQVYLCIELIRQFYDAQRVFRIRGEGGRTDFIRFDNRRLLGLDESALPGYKKSGRQFYTGMGEGNSESAAKQTPADLAARESRQKIEMPAENGTGEQGTSPAAAKITQQTDQNEKTPLIRALVAEFLQGGQRRRPVFDVVCKAQKANPFSRMSQNELAKELYSAGFFDAQKSEAALIALDLMDFEGKEKTVEAIKNQQLLLKQLEQVSRQNEMLKIQLDRLTAPGMPGNISAANEASVTEPDVMTAPKNASANPKIRQTQPSGDYISDLVRRTRNGK